MEGKRYSNSFTSSGMVKEEGRAAYYKLLDSVRDGDTVRIKRGVYATTEQLADTMIDVQAIVPGGVLCLFSAWNVHGLTTTLPQSYHIAVKRGRKVTLPVFPKVELHHITDTMFDIGVENQIVSGYRIQICNKELPLLRLNAKNAIFLYFHPSVTPFFASVCADCNFVS